MKERLDIHITKNGLLESIQDATGWTMAEIAMAYRAQERLGRICSMVRTTGYDAQVDSGINSKDLKGVI